MSGYELLGLLLIGSALAIIGWGVCGEWVSIKADEEWDQHADAALRLTSETPMYADLRAEYLVREIAEWETQR